MTSNALGAGDIFNQPNISISTTGTVSSSKFSFNPAGQVQPALVADGTISCKELKIDNVNMKVLVEQLTQMIPIFIPPEGLVMENTAVKNAYKSYMAARRRLVATRDHLDLLIRLSDQGK